MQTASASGSDEPLKAFIDQNGLGHLRPQLEGETLDSLSAMERVPMLSHLKARGLALVDRQKLATAVAKAVRISKQQPPPTEPASIDSLAAYKEPEPQGFSIYCHRTTLSDGTSLDNTARAPEFIIAEVRLIRRLHPARRP
jgi:hypothetical protein